VNARPPLPIRLDGPPHELDLGTAKAELLRMDLPLTDSVADLALDPRQARIAQTIEVARREQQRRIR
jgi:hypothetical protein